MSMFASSCPKCGTRVEAGVKFCPAHANGGGRPSSCEVCGRRTEGRRCELHPMTEAERLSCQPWRRGYGCSEFRRNRTLVIQRAGGVCECGCGRPLGAGVHVGHIVPLIDGGTNVLSNLQAVRKDCNYRQMGSDMVARRRQRTGGTP